jgi:Glycosyl hydrolase 36 superfamily, catalytic domain/Glycosyltransferase family 36
MSVSRRKFLETAALTVAAAKAASGAVGNVSRNFGSVAPGSNAAKAYGSGYFGGWIQDEFELPAFHYTCDQIKDPKAATEVNPGILSATEHIHQVGNDRIVAIASNYGHVRVRQDEGAPKFLNDYAPERGYFGGGFGYLTDGTKTLSTFYPGNADSFDRVFGIGYFRKKVAAHGYAVDQTIFAPFGDDPVLISQVSVTNSGAAEANLRWIEFWGCQVYQFSFRAFFEMFAGKGLHESRREFGTRFKHHVRSVAEGSGGFESSLPPNAFSGLLEAKEFLGPDPAAEQRFQGVVASFEKSPNVFLTAPDSMASTRARFDDFNPPRTFLISLDAAVSGMTTNAKEFFGSGGTSHPAGIEKELDGDLTQSGPECGLLLERKFLLKPGESRTLTFLHGYRLMDTDLYLLATKYRKSAERALRDSCAQWKNHGLRFSTPEESWVEREVTWNHYYLRSGFTYDDFFKQHIVSQASIYQYVMGFQGAARDPLQHALPFLFSDPDLVKEVLRYTLSEVRPDGSIPYGIVGHGLPMPTTSDRSSDMPMWLIWAVSEYVLATRDTAFLDSDVVTMYGKNAGRESVRNLLARCYRHQIDDVRTGEHGLMRMLQDDWNDALVNAWTTQAESKEVVEKGESVLNSAMAAYVFDYYARMLAYSGEKDLVTLPIRQKAEEHRKAVRGQWAGKWFRRAWMGPANGWLGETCMWIEPQPWTLISGIPTEEQTQTLVKSIDRELRQVSPIGAIQLTAGPDQTQRGAWHSDPGTQVNGGVWPSLNQTLIWALAGVDGAMAWDEWKKNSFARHAEVYPEIWYGTWSGPDVLNSALSAHPGATTGGKPFGWTDFPVLNMHTHACPLYALSKLMGLEFTESGIVLAPKIPLASFRFESALLGVVKSERGYEGWYDPGKRDSYSVRFKLSPEDAKRISRVEVNGKKVEPRVEKNALEMRGNGGGGTPLRWSVFR